MSGCVIFSSIYSMREVEMAVLLGICLSAQKPALACRPFPIQGSWNTFRLLCPSYSLKPTLQSMSNMTIQGAAVGAEAGKLQADPRNVFSRLLSHARTIDMTMTLGDSTEALGQIRELEAYLERGLEVLSKPLTYES